MSTTADALMEHMLRAWIADSDVDPPAHVTVQARAAMHRAVAARALAHRSRWFIVWPGTMGRVRLRRRGLGWMLAGATAVSILAATVVTIGWNAPTGSPLHSVRLAREKATLTIVGGAELRLTYAEARLGDARGQSGGDRAASLSEARQLLDDARIHLPADHTSPLWSRWQSDEGELQGDDQRSSPGSGGTAPVAPGGGDGGAGSVAPAHPSPSGEGGTRGDDGRPATSVSPAPAGDQPSAPDGGRERGSSSSTSSTSSRTLQGVTSPSPTPDH